jgi:hypothetical protein
VPGQPPAPSRRSALIGGCAGLIGLVGTGLGAAACSRGGGTPAPSEPPSPAPAPDPDTGVRESAHRAEEALIALHAATVARHPGLGAALAPAMGHHRLHLDALAGTDRRTAATGSGPGAGSPTPSTTTTAPPPRVPDDRAAALTAVRDAEAAAAAERLLDCLASTDTGLAAVLASVGAAEAAHAELLAGGT